MVMCLFPFMFQKTPLFSPLIDTRFLANTLKGGDFMGKENGISIPESIVGLNNSRFPERVMEHDNRPTALEIATTGTIAGRLVIDRVTLASVGSMDGRE